MAPQYDLCERCKRGHYVPEKSINTGETWYFCNACFKYKQEFQDKIDVEMNGSPRSKGAVFDDTPDDDDDSWFKCMSGLHL